MTGDLTVVKDLRDLQIPDPAIVVIGKFDGVHIGHQAILREAAARKASVQQAHGARRAVLVAVTFDPLPAQFFRPEQALKLLNTPQERLWLAHQLGVDVGVCLRFDQELAQKTSEEFVALLKRHVNMVELVVGEDFALGHQRTGTVENLRELGRLHDFRVTTISEVQNGTEVVRSRGIRDLLEQGDMARANGRLGHAHFVAGRVITGGKQARQLGFPTANLAVDPSRCYPKSGVYATRTWISQPFGGYASVTNLGYRPTFQGTEFRVETHLLDFPRDDHDGNLYDQVIAVAFIQRLREEIRFPSVEALCTQVAHDIQHARTVLPQSPAPPATARFMQALLPAMNCADPALVP